MLLKAWPEGVDKPKDTQEFFTLISNYSFVQKVAPKIDQQDFKHLAAQLDTLSMDILTVIGLFFLMSCLNCTVDLICEKYDSKKR